MQVSASSARAGKFGGRQVTCPILQHGNTEAKVVEARLIRRTRIRCGSHWPICLQCAHGMCVEAGDVPVP